MTGLFLFFAAAGVPLVLWFVLGGGEEGGDDGVGAGMFGRLPITTLAFFAAAFGACGLLLDLTGAGAPTALVGAAVAGGLAAAANRTVFSYLRRTESTSQVADDQLSGRIGRVVVPVAGGRRGRISVSVGDQQIHLSALALPDAPAELPVGSSVLVVEVHDGVAAVTGLDPELA